eukprot:CAMPEP_0114668350 /NCGR_PEP_ID=MMETSP0191-20121206/36088_1 /TAXON_ID=126664 /ORGANISM="Sorites sp." /LENGTH=215 /DNA_ID=CAMNT_0001921141 /DNA_START=281 /DNA_END=928 /DNA_ORIENTATION=-
MPRGVRVAFTVQASIVLQASFFPGRIFKWNMLGPSSGIIPRPLDNQTLQGFRGVELFSGGSLGWMFCLHGLPSSGDPTISYTAVILDSLCGECFRWSFGPNYLIWPFTCDLVVKPLPIKLCAISDYGFCIVAFVGLLLEPYRMFVFYLSVMVLCQQGLSRLPLSLAWLMLKCLVFYLWLYLPLLQCHWTSLRWHYPGLGNFASDMNTSDILSLAA